MGIREIGNYGAKQRAVHRNREMKKIVKTIFFLYKLNITSPPLLAVDS